MNRFDTYIIDYLYEKKEVALSKIGIIKASAFSAEHAQQASIEFTCNKKISTSEELINYIAEKTAKNKSLIAADIESHLAQTREFLNIGKSYEIADIGFIKSNNSGVYEFIPYSEINKPARTSTQPDKHTKTNSRSIIQVITLLIVVAILSGLGWEAYQFFIKSKTNNTAALIKNNSDTATKVSNTVVQNSNDINDTNSITKQQIQYSANDIVNIRYIFETTASELRAQTRTAQLKSFGNNAGFDSIINNHTKFYSLYIIKPTKISDTLTVKDSLAKFLQRDINLEIEKK
ncbi:MAG: hypothetical protein ABI405_02270 [Parafilimonas sp.]